MTTFTGRCDAVNDERYFRFLLTPFCYHSLLQVACLFSYFFDLLIRFGKHWAPAFVVSDSITHVEFNIGIILDSTLNDIVFDLDLYDWVAHTDAWIFDYYISHNTTVLMIRLSWLYGLDAVIGIVVQSLSIGNHIVCWGLNYNLLLISHNIVEPIFISLSQCLLRFWKFCNNFL